MLRICAKIFYFLQSLSSPLSPCKRHPVPPPRINLEELVPEPILDKEPPAAAASDTEVVSPGPTTCASPREKGRFEDLWNNLISKQIDASELCEWGFDFNLS